MAWYKAHLLNPFARAMENLANDDVSMMQDFRGLKKAFKIVPKNLRKKIKDVTLLKNKLLEFIYGINKVWMFLGLSQKDQKDLVDFVKCDANLTSFCRAINSYKQRR